jgi:hypothetical protein
MKSMQYTIRGISDRVDSVAREQAARYHRSLNGVLVDALEKGLGAGTENELFHDMDDLAGTWVDDTGFDEAVEAFNAVDENLWK